MSPSDEDPRGGAGTARAAASGRTTSRAIGWSTLGTASQFFAMAAVLPTTSRLIPASAFGATALALSAATILSGFALGVLSQAIIEPDELDQSSVNTLWTTALILGLTGLAIMMVIAIFPGVVGTQVSSAFALLSPLVCLKLIGRVARADRMRELRFASLAAGQACSYLVGYMGVTLFLAIYADWDLHALCFGFLAQDSIMTMWYILNSRYGRPTSWAKPSDVWDLARRHFSMGLASLFSFGSNQVDNLTIGAALGTASLGQYTRAFRLSLLPANLFGDSMGIVLFPAFASLRGSPLRHANAVAGTVYISLILVIPFSTCLSIYAPTIVHTVLGNGWEAAILPLRIVAFAAPFRIAVKTCSAALRSTGSRSDLPRLMFAQVVMIGLASLLGASQGLGGASAGVLLGSASSSLYGLALLWDRLALDVARLVRSLLAAVAAGTIAFLLSLVLATDSFSLGPIVTILINVLAAYGLAFGMVVMMSTRPNQDDARWARQQVITLVRGRVR